MRSNNSGSARAVLTIACGNVRYLELAYNLAKSVALWHSSDDLPVYIATDSPAALRTKAPENVRFINVTPGEFGHGFKPKLFLDKLAPAEQTLFIDSDCLVYCSLSPLFSRFAGQAVGVVGNRVSEGEWFGDISHYCQCLGVSAITQFNGGIYYLERSKCTPVYSRARDLFPQYEAMGLKLLRGCPDDELLIAGAMAQESLWGIQDDGSILGDQQACPGPISLDILRGFRVLTNPPPPSPLNCPWNRFSVQRPAIVHFLSSYAQEYPYRAEELALSLFSVGIPRSICSFLATLRFKIPGYAMKRTKNLLRPFFHRVIGTRKVKSSFR